MSERKDSEGEDLANFLDGLFRSGQASEVLNKAFNPPQETTLVNLPSLDTQMESFVNILLPMLPRMEEKPRAAAQGIREIFEDWRKRTITILERSVDKKPELREQIDALGVLTLKDVSNFTKEKIKQFRADSESLTDYSRNYLRNKEQIKFWQRLDDILGPASDPD